MGLDGVELVLAIEDEFSISIEDQEAMKVRTVGDLQSLVLSKIGIPEKGDCLTSRAFYAVRKPFIEVLGAKRAALGPEHRLEALIPESGRKRTWRRLSASVKGHRGLELPPLGLKRRIAMAIVALVVLVPVLALFAGSVHLVRGTFAWLIGICVPAAALAGASRLPDTAYDLPADTMGGLARVFLAHNFKEIRAGSKGWTEEEVREVVRHLIVEQLGVKPEEVVPSASLVDDLGLS